LYRSRFFIAPIPMRLILEDLSGLTRAGFGVQLPGLEENRVCVS
jgi:hypothetical protein